MNQQDLLPADVCEELAKLFNKKFAAYRGERTFSVSSSMENDYVVTNVLLRNSNGSYHYNVESRINFADAELKAEAAAFFLVDYSDLYFEAYFLEDESVYLPINWAKHSYEGCDFEMKGQILNQHLESLADEILAKDTLNNLGTDQPH